MHVSATQHQLLCHWATQLLYHCFSPPQPVLFTLPHIMRIFTFSLLAPTQDNLYNCSSEWFRLMSLTDLLQARTSLDDWVTPHETSDHDILLAAFSRVFVAPWSVTRAGPLAQRGSRMPTPGITTKKEKRKKKKQRQVGIYQLTQSINPTIVRLCWTRLKQFEQWDTGCILFLVFTFTASLVTTVICECRFTESSTKYELWIAIRRADLPPLTSALLLVFFWRLWRKTRACF